jgi:glycosyltransferase involved in cell wall biosynthesis
VADVNVSVIVATHGGMEWQHLAAERAVPSLAGQHAEVIVYHDVDATLAAVRNTAAAGASGDWLCFLDADDRLGIGYLDAMRAAFYRGADDGSLLGEIDGDGNVLRQLPAPALLVPAVQAVGRDGFCHGEPAIPSRGRTLAELNCGVIGTLVPRLLFEQVGGFHELPMYEDWELWQRCVIAGARLVAVPDAVYCAHVAAGGGRNLPDRATQVSVYNAIRARHAAHYAVLAAAVIP